MGSEVVEVLAWSKLIGESTYTHALCTMCIDEAISSSNFQDLLLDLRWHWHNAFVRIFCEYSCLHISAEGFLLSRISALGNMTNDG